MRILITGGAGFIGTNLVRKLVSQNHEIICIDNLISGKKENIKELLILPSFKFIQADIIDTNAFNNIGEVDQIYNLACPASPMFYQRNAIHTLKTCFLGMINVLEFAKKYNAKVLQTSTSEVYGDPLVLEQSELYYGNVNPNGIRACYDEGKRVAETICCDYRRTYKLDIKIVRIFNTYGPYMRKDDGRVISNFINNILEGKAISIYGDGKQTRSMCYVSDMVEGLIAMMNSQCNGPINLGNPTEISVNELAYLIKNLMQSNVDIQYCNSLEDDPRKRKPDITIAKECLNWNPKVPLDEGLIYTIRYYKNKA